MTEQNISPDAAGEAQWAVDARTDQLRDDLDALVIATRGKVAEALGVYARALQECTRGEESADIHALIRTAAEEVSNALNQARLLAEQDTYRRVSAFEYGYQAELGELLDGWQIAARHSGGCCPDCCSG